MSVVQKVPGLYELAILSRVLRPSQGELSEEAARAILALDFDPADRERMHDLVLKAQDGQLTTDEEQEADSYERISHLLGLLRSKARNIHKGPNIAGLDPNTGALTRLFNPRTDRWVEHFCWDGPYLRGRTAEGRTTIAVLCVNTPHRVAFRMALLEEGVFFPHGGEE